MAQFVVSKTRKEGAIFFCIAVVVICICAVATNYLRTTPFYRFHQGRRARSEVLTLIQTPMQAAPAAISQLAHLINVGTGCLFNCGL